MSEKQSSEQLYGEIVEFEKKLRLILHKKHPLDKDVTLLRNSLRDKYEELIFADFEFANSKDIEQNLWKLVFYKVIEAYRKRIRKVLITKSSPDSGAKEELHKICSSFRRFLGSSSHFYTNLVKNLQVAFNLKLDGSVIYSPDESKEPNPLISTDKQYISCHRCYIFLGDLARYHRDLHGEPDQKDWTKAEIFYQKALQLIPDNGNPHNQLAVVSTYVDDELNAVYRYFRSLAVQYPFITAKDNLVVLFEKNRQKVAGLGRPDSRINTRNNSKTWNRKGSANVDHLILLFIRLHGILSTKTSLEIFKEILDETLKLFIQVLHKAELEETVLLKLFAINIFSIENPCDEPPTTYAEVTQRAVITKCATQLAFFFFYQVITSAKSRPLKYLGPITVFLDWLASKSSILKAELNKELGCCPPLWNALGEVIGKLWEIKELRKAKGEWKERRKTVLFEELELRGYLPLNDAWKHVDYGCVKHFDQNEEKMISECIRIDKVLEFSQFIEKTEKKILFVPFVEEEKENEEKENNNNNIENKDKKNESIENEDENEDIEDEDDFYEDIEFDDDDDLGDDEVILFKPVRLVEDDLLHEEEMEEDLKNEKVMNVNGSSTSGNAVIGSERNEKVHRETHYSSPHKQGLSINVGELRKEQVDRNSENISVGSAANQNSGAGHSSGLRNSGSSFFSGFSVPSPNSSNHHGQQTPAALPNFSSYFFNKANTANDKQMNGSDGMRRPDAQMYAVHNPHLPPNRMASPNFVEGPFPFAPAGASYRPSTQAWMNGPPPYGGRSNQYMYAGPQNMPPQQYPARPMQFPGYQGGPPSGIVEQPFRTQSRGRAVRPPPGLFPAENSGTANGSGRGEWHQHPNGSVPAAANNRNAQLKANTKNPFIS